MRIAVISDTRLPTAAEYPGHGLGKSCLAIAEGLAGRGHTVALFAGAGSASRAVDVMTGEDETALARLAFAWAPDVVIDGGHEHRYQAAYPGYPVVNRSGDREHKPGRNAVYVSRAQALWFDDPNGRVVYTGVDVSQYPVAGQPEEWLLWLGPVNIGHKGVQTAIQVAGLAGMPLLIAGTGTIRHEGFIGPVWGRAKLDLMSRARAVLVTGEIEAGPRTAIEAAACGTPAIGLAKGGTPEYIGHGLSGFLAMDAGEMAERLKAGGLPSAEECRWWVREHRSLAQMIAGYEDAAKAAMAGLTSGQTARGVQGMTGAEWREKHTPGVQMSLDNEGKGSL